MGHTASRPFGHGPLPGAQLVLGALVGQVSHIPALVAPGLVLVLTLPDELRGSSVVGRDGGGDGAPIEDLPVHLTRSRERVGGGDELDEGDALADARGAVLEDGDARDLAEGGEERVEIGVCESKVEVRHVEGRLGGSEASRASSAFGIVFVGFRGCCGGGCGGRI